MSSSRAGAVAAMAPAILWAGITPLGFRQRLTKVVRCSVVWPLSERRVAIRRASGTVREVPAERVVRGDDCIEGEVALDEVAGLLPGGSGADGGGEYECQAAFARPQLGRCSGHEGRAEAGGGGRLPGLEAA